jgi:hypothetical protein
MLERTACRSSYCSGLIVFSSGQHKYWQSCYVYMLYLELLLKCFTCGWFRNVTWLIYRYSAIAFRLHWLYSVQKIVAYFSRPQIVVTTPSSWDQTDRND